MYSASERIKPSQDRAKDGEKRTRRLPALTPEQVEKCRRMAEGSAGLRHMARVVSCSPATVRKALDTVADGSFWGHGDEHPAAGWHKVYGQLQKGDTLVVAFIDRIFSPPPFSKCARFC